MARRYTYEQAVAAFWSRVEVVQANECWFWRGPRTRRGYGRFMGATSQFIERGMKATRRAHRIAYFIAHGHVPAEKFLLHSCDQPRCVNPAHLTAGTHEENMLDMRTKNRSPRSFGEANGQAKLTTEAVRAYRAARQAGEKLAELARSLGVSKKTLVDIDRGRTWRNIA